MKKHISQDSALAGKSIMKRLIVEYPIIGKKGIRKKYSNVFSVQGKHGTNIESKRYQIIAAETMIHRTYAIVFQSRGEDLTGIFLI